MGRAPCCDKANVKKGPWSPEEDAKLKFFIEQNGTGGNWITLPSKAGLKRCGKSCRLRWLNYLRPDIKHGSFSEDEEKTIYRLHGQIGSRWSLIASQLPGRTDNDIKNYWNTRLKKKLSERGNVSHVHYGRLQPYQQHMYNLQGKSNQMATAAAGEALLHGQHSYSINHLYPQQMEYLQQHHHQVVHHQVVQDQTVQLPTVIQPQTVLARTVDEAERLMVIESSLRNIIGSSCGGGDSRRSIADNPLPGLFNTTILGSQRQVSNMQNSASASVDCFDESALFGEDLGFVKPYHRSDDVAMVVRGNDDEWWNRDPPSSSRAGAVKWPIHPPQC